MDTGNDYGGDAMKDYKDIAIIIAIVMLAFAGYEIITSHPLICLGLVALYILKDKKEE